jgi:hypothetical protein
MHNAPSAIALPQTAFEQRHGEGWNSLDPMSGEQQAGRFIRLTTRGGAKEAAIDRRILDPFRSRAAIGAQQPDADAIDMQARAHRFAEHFQPEANGRRIEQFAEYLGEQGDVSSQRRASGTRRQAAEIGLLPRGKRLAQAAAEIADVGGQPVGNDRFGGPLPLGKLYFRIEDARQAERIVGDGAIAGCMAG